MNLTSIMLFLIIFFMIIIQICFRENYSIIDQKKFRKNLVDYYSKKYIDAPSDGNEVKCKIFNNRKKNGLYVPLKNKKICEGFSPIETTEMHEKVKKCEIVNNISLGNDWKASDWRTRISKIPKDTIKINDRQGGKKKAGCGFCYDNKKILFGDDYGPFDSEYSPALCENWLRPGEDENNKAPGGTTEKKNLFAKSYPFPNEVDSQGLKGIQNDAVKLHEQELCSQMKNCSDQKYTHADGTALCGWCSHGRMGDGNAVGMVRKGGRGTDQNDTKYDDDYCVWSREIDEAGKKTIHWGQKRDNNIEKSKEFKIWTDPSNSELRGKVPYPGKLMNGKKHCDAAGEFFPCFPNFSGKVSVDGAPPKHSDECYQSLWDEFAVWKPNDGEEKKCNGKIKTRLTKHLPNSRTFSLWDKTYIPSVENAIRDIPKRAMTSKQYNDTNPNSIENPAVQMMFSANRNHKACFDKEAEACDDRFRSREYRYPRPKKCIDDILTTASIEGFRLGETKPEYQPDEPDTYKYNWAVHNVPGYANNIHYDMKNETFEESVRDDMKYYENNKKLIKYNSKEQSVSSLRNKYDTLLVKSYILFGEFKEELKFWKDNKGGMATQFPWVKLCWEDFRKFMEETYPDQVQIKKNGELMIKKSVEDTICNSFVDPNKSSCCTESDLLRCKGSVFTEKTNSELSSPLILKKLGNDTFITKEIYERKLFPFWRLLPKKYFVASEWKRMLEKKIYDGIPFKGSVKITSSRKLFGWGFRIRRGQRRTTTAYWTFGWDTGNKSLGKDNNSLYATINKYGKNSAKINIMYNKTVGTKDYYNVTYGNKYLVNAGSGRSNRFVWVEKKCPSRCRRHRSNRRTCTKYVSHWNYCGSSEAFITWASGGTNCLGCGVDDNSLFEIESVDKENLKFYLKQRGKYVAHDGEASTRKNGVTYIIPGKKEDAILFQG